MADNTVAAGDEALLNDPRCGEILDIVAKETGVPRDRLTTDADIAELGIASLDLAETMFAIESKYDVEIPVVSERTGAEFTTVGQLLTHVLRTIDSHKPAHG